jgi:hypothetical protein
MIVVVIGIVIGFLAGMFGVGGSSISTPALRVFLHVPPLIALATPLPVAIPTAVTGGLVYYRRGLVNRQVFAWCAVTGIPGVVLGSLTSHFVSGQGLMLLTAVVVLVVGLRFLADSLPWSSTLAPVVSQHTSDPEPTLLALIGLTVGFLSGLLANGGGFLLIPAFVFLLRLPVKEAMPTSLAVVAAFALPGTAVHLWLGHIDPWLMLQFALGVIPATYLGTQVSLRLSSRQLQALFGAFLVLFAAYFAYLQLAGVG